jgi:nucleoside-diphosphate-sugar epimerase
LRTVLVTGAAGFIGRHLCSALASKGYSLHLAVRPNAEAESSKQSEYFFMDDMGPRTSWRDALQGVDSIVHLAARAHVTRETSAHPLVEFRRVNVQGTEKLAMDAAGCGVRRLVFMSSIGVNGNKTPGSPFSESDAPHPHDDYSLSKCEAEQALRRIAEVSGMEIVVLRAPLVYGPGVGAKFLSLLRWVDGGWPLPVGAMRNPRSLIYVRNLVEAVILGLEQPQAAGKTYIVSDDDGLSIRDLVARLAGMMGKRARLLNVPLALLKWAARPLGKAEIIEQLGNPLVADASLIRRELGWRPSVTADDGLRATVDWYLNSRDRRA